ncbi:sensor histidine kinase [Flagellimonas lutimaris]|uniref:Sensor histidine kinase n=1 Tax=Flagellimonas lutimaris TaxID=475082 RepID=A0A3A1N4I1_9FLAO|nr:histidine kinase [Allomuricauda lutimaris]RIV31639.1 sensor histidine kinase [Allomuricauda lutimaris]
MKFKKHHRKRAILFLVSLAMIPIFITLYEVIFTENRSVMFLGDYNPKIVIVVIFYYAFLLCLGAYWFIRQLIFISKLKNEKSKVELMLLKSQVSPHFFFNMLNNLYGLVAKDAEKAQELILKLSDLMRYSIYESDNETVTLKEEVDYLKNYIELHKMRYHKNIVVDFICDIDENKQVTPLLFIILLENAFKHGVENLRENANVKINFTSSKNNIKFEIENNFDSSENLKNEPGIGLKNLKRRLELTYPNKHKLRFTSTEDSYSAQLILN